MENEYRYVNCPGCARRLRIAVTAESYGKRVKITCPKCFTECRTVIQKPPVITKDEDLRDFLSGSLDDSIMDFLFGTKKR